MAYWCIHDICMKMITSPLHIILGPRELLNKITLTKMPLAWVFLKPSLTDLYSVSTGIYWVPPMFQVFPPTQWGGCLSQVLWTRNWDSGQRVICQKWDSQSVAQPRWEAGPVFQDLLHQGYHCEIYGIPLC